jgi:hypothetical protein
MKKNQSGQQQAFSLTLVLLIVMSIVSVYFFIKYQQAKNLLTNPNIAVQTEIKKLVEQIGKLIELPTDEVPSMATVTDKNKLVNQAFFAKAQNGDKILLYQENHKAILYRPSINKIIEISAVTIPTTSPSPIIHKSANITPVPIAKATPTPTKPADVTVAIYNGSKIAGLAALYEKQITSKLTFVNVVEKSNTLNNYSKTLVIDLSGNKKDQAQQIATVVTGEVTASLPSGEKKPQADILVIVGKL